MTKCATCSLSKETRATVDEMMLSGVAIADIERWLISQGESPSRKSLENHKNKHLDLSKKKDISHGDSSESQGEIVLGDPRLSSQDLHLKVLREMAKQADRLLVMSQIPSLRTERLLGERLSALHDALSEISFEGEK